MMVARQRGERRLGDAGVINALDGDARRTLGTGSALFSQDTPASWMVPRLSDWFGSALYSADFNGDGDDHVAVDVHFEDVDSVVNAGAVNVLYGGSSDSGKRRRVLPPERLRDPGSGGARGRFRYRARGRRLRRRPRRRPRRRRPGESLGSIELAGKIHAIYGILRRTVLGGQPTPPSERRWCSRRGRVRRWLRRGVLDRVPQGQLTARRAQVEAPGRRYCRVGPTRSRVHRAERHASPGVELQELR